MRFVTFCTANAMLWWLSWLQTYAGTRDKPYGITKNIFGKYQLRNRKSPKKQVLNELLS